MENVETPELTGLEWVAYFAMSTVPPILMGIIFYIVMRAIFRADSTERKVYAEIEAEERAKRKKLPNA
jgi:Na+/H+ antiporter NhaD/arsenite permease-like protein